MDWRKICEANLACLPSIKVSWSSLKALLEQHFLNTVKLCPNDKNRGLNHKIREIRKIKTILFAGKIFELLFLFKTSCKGKLFSDNNLLA